MQLEKLNRLRRLPKLVSDFIATHRLWAVLTSCWVLSTLLGWCLYESLLVFSAILLAVLSVGMAWPWICIRGVSAQLRFSSPRITEGETTSLSLRLVNYLPWPVCALVVRLGPGNARGGDWTIGHLPLCSDCEFHWPYQPVKRGVHPLGQVELSSSFPFGLWEARRLVWVSEPVIVWPKTYPVKLAPVQGQPNNWVGEPNPGLVGYGGDVLGVRWYRPGEPKKRIHWPQSLRLAQLVICEFEAESRVPVQIVLDSDPSNWDGVDPGSLREWAIRWAASLAKSWLEMGYAVGLVSLDSVVPPRAGHPQLLRILDTLAKIPDTCTGALPQLLSQAKRLARAFTVVITSESSIGLPGVLHSDHTTYWIVFGLRGNGSAPAGLIGQRRYFWVMDPVRSLSLIGLNGMRARDVNGT